MQCWLLSRFLNIFDHIHRQSYYKFSFVASKDGIYQRLGQFWVCILQVKCGDVVYDGLELRRGSNENRKQFMWFLNLHSGLKLNFKWMSTWRKTPSCCRGSWDSQLQKLLGLNLMVKEGEESEFLRPFYTISEEAKDADAKLVNQKKGAQGRDKELGRKEEEHRQLKDREGREMKRTKVPERYGKCLLIFWFTALMAAFVLFFSIIFILSLI